MGDRGTVFFAHKWVEIASICAIVATAYNEQSQTIELKVKKAKTDKVAENHYDVDFVEEYHDRKTYDNRMRSLTLACFDKPIYFGQTVKGSNEIVCAEDTYTVLNAKNIKKYDMKISSGSNKFTLLAILDDGSIFEEEYGGKVVADERINQLRRMSFSDTVTADTEDPNCKHLKIKYHSSEIDKLCYVDGKSDWIDLRSAEKVELKKGDFHLVKLGISMAIPKGYEAHIVPRSSTFKNYGIIQTNHCGIIDNSYSGDNDEWMMPVYATRDCVINVNDRICQFRIFENQPSIVFDEVEHLDGEDRGGFGSTGVS